MLGANSNMPVYTPEKIEFGLPLPSFNLLGVDGKSYTQKHFQNGEPLVVMFICNHCPYVQAIEDRLIQLAHDLKKINVNVVAICSNDEINYPDDRFEKLQERATLKKYSFTYLHDSTQEVAHRFGAVCTPDFFVYDKQGKLAYRGRLDNSWKDATIVSERELYRAVLELHQNQPVSQPQTPSMGCSIKWTRK